jgi:signal transduction histidine kinase
MRLRRPRYTVRLRLTLLYGGVFLVTGALLLGFSYLLVRQTTSAPSYAVTGTSKGIALKGPEGPVAFAMFHFGVPPGDGSVTARVKTPPAEGASRVSTITSSTVRQAGGSVVRITSGGHPASGATGLASLLPAIPPATLKQAEAQAKQLRQLGVEQRHHEQHQLLIILGVALAVMAIVSMGLGWLVAGRALRPLHTITKTARAISASNLHRRLSLKGPRDELRELGDTFDDLLERLERSFAAQRQFVANASHELRTPLTLERAIVEVALADPDASQQSLRETCERVLAIGDQQERMIEALLALARSERGLERRVTFDLRAVVGRVIASRRPEVARHRLRLDSELASALTAGDPQLVERLVVNLLDNAISHNEPGGWIRVATGMESGCPFLEVSNSGPLVPADEVEQLFEPFRRLGAERSARGDGHGLGLSIVAAVASAHGARTIVRARSQGGLDFEVRFAAPNSADTHALPRSPAQNGAAGDSMQAAV